MTTPSDPSEAGCVVVFGASSGIGAATAVALARRHVQVVAVARHPTGVLDRPLTAEARSRLDPVAADATDPEDVDRVFDHARATHGRVRSVVHSVGFPYEVGWYRDIDPQHAIDAITAFLTSPAIVVARALGVMDDAGGAVGIVSSGAAGRSTPGRALYSATKIAVNRLVDSVAAECAAGGTHTAVFAISPGRVDTPMQRRLVQTAAGADPAFRLDRFRSTDEVAPAEPVGEAIASLALLPPVELNGRLFRYRPDGWEIDAP